MNALSATVSRTAEAVPWTLDISLPSGADLLPLLVLSLVPILGLALWLLAVAGYTSRRGVHASC